MALLLVVGGANALEAQVPPPQSVGQLSPAEIERIRQELIRSGLTAAQAADRLRQQGLLSAPTATNPSGLDPNAGAAAPASPPTAADSARRVQILRAIQDSVLLDSLRLAIGNDSMRTALVALLRTPAMRHATADSGFQIFGQDVFTRPVGGVSDVNVVGPVGDSYRIAPRDQLLVTLTGDVERSIPITVSAEGYIVFENLGPPLQVVGLTKREAELRIFERLSRTHSTLRRDNSGTMQMMFSIVSQGTKGVKVMGDVITPGEYFVANSATIISALYMAGGPTDRGTWRAVQLRRGNQTIGVLDLYDYLTKGSTGEDFRVESGDVVFVPPRGDRVRLAGQVLRPATYELKRGETLRDLIQLAGGFNAAADRRRIQIERILPPSQRGESGRDRQVFDIMDPSLAAGLAPATALEPGDIVRVAPIATRVGGRVFVNGNVWSGGAVAFAPGMRLSQAISRAGGPKSDTYLGQVNISRLQGDSTRIILRSALRDTLGVPTDDILLVEGDEIELFSLTSFRPTRYVEIAGEVNNPGRYPYREGMTTRDLAIEASGIKESALLTKAELSRMPEDRAGGTLAVTTVFALDSLYFVERGADGRYHGPPGIQGAARSPEVVLKPYDHVLILRQPDWSYQQTVTVSGQVVLPGEYTLKTKDDRISDIILRAGNITADAYANGMVFTRRDVGRIGVDLPAVLADPKHNDNLLLVDGDVIEIPKSSGIVTVTGAVNSPVTVAWKPGEDIDYYILAAGRETARGDEGKAFVTQPNGKVESKRREWYVNAITPVPQSGSVVTVPEKDTSTNWLASTNNVLSATLTLLGSVLAIVAIAK